MKSLQFFIFLKIDCSTNQEICDNNEIEAYPTFLLYYNGEIVNTNKYSSVLLKLLYFCRLVIIMVKSFSFLSHLIH